MICAVHQWHAVELTGSEGSVRRLRKYFAVDVETALEKAPVSQDFFYRFGAQAPRTLVIASDAGGKVFTVGFFIWFNDINAPEVFLPPVGFPYGSAHASELLYLFKLTWPGQLNAEQRKLSNNMIRYWTQFAKSGDPNSSGVPFWPQYDTTTDEFQSLLPPSPTTELEFATDHKCDFWATLFGARPRRAPRTSR